MILELDEVHTYYGTSHILQGVSLSLEKGKCCVLLGRNGVGKTTTVNTVAGLLSPKEGAISFEHQAINGLPSWKIARKGIGFVPQGRRIFPSLSIKENLTMPSRKGTSEHRKEWDLESVYNLFPILQERENNMGNELSGGQQQMLAIARALMTNPELIIMDEPSEGLAPVMVEYIGDVIVKLKESGLTILMVEQNISLACRVADEVIIMNKGQIVWSGSPDDLMQNEDIQHQYLGV